MPLTLSELEALREDFLAEDVEIDIEKMQNWTIEDAEAYFESGGEVEPKAKSDDDKPLDVIIFGPSGIVGSTCCSLLSDMAKNGSDAARRFLGNLEKPPKWGIAGRAASKEKIDKVATQYGVPSFLVSKDDPASFDAICAATNLVVAVAGPYRQQIPRQLAAACARNKGVCYFDLTGEFTFVADCIEKHDAEAKANNSCLIHMCGPREICSAEVGTLLACAALRQQGAAGAASVEIVGCSGGDMKASGGTIASRMFMHEEPERAEDPWLLLPKVVDVSDEPERGIDLPDEWVNDYKTVESSKVWGETIIGPELLASGNVRMLRRVAHLLHERDGVKDGEPAILPPGGGTTPVLAARQTCLFREADKLQAHFTLRFMLEKPEKLLKQVAAGQLPKQGEGPSEAESRRIGYVEWAVARTTVPGGKNKSGADEKVAACKVKGPHNQGMGISCGYGGSAYCILAAAMTAREMGKIPEKRCGAGMTPGTALDLDKLQKRLERVGYVFSICAPPSTEEIQKATEEMALLPTK